MNTAGNIRRVIELRVAMGFRDERFSSKMKDTFNRMRFECPLQILRVGEISLEELVLPDKVAMARRKVVKNERLEPALAECSYRVTSDVACPAGNQNHRFPTPK
jgi:hypothetical protein